MDKTVRLREFLIQLPDFVYDYIAVAYNGESVNTQLAYSIDIKIFLEYLRRFKFRSVQSLEEFTPSMLDEVTLTDLNKFKSYLLEYETEFTDANGVIQRRVHHNGAEGINRKLSGIRGLYLYLYKNDLIEKNITDKLDFQKLHHKMKRPLTTQETRDLIDVIYSGEKYFEGRDLSEYKNKKLRDIALFTAYLGTGCRVSEIVGLNINSVDFSTLSFIVKRKGGDEQEIFMPPAVTEHLLDYIEQRRNEDGAKDDDPIFLNRLGKRMSVQAVEMTLKKYCLTAGITDPSKCKPHALRRTFACNMIADGIDIKMVAELMGHKNIEVTHKYYARYAVQKHKEVMKQVKIPGAEDE